MKNIYEKDMYACLTFALLFFATAIFSLHEKEMTSLIISTILSIVFLVASLNFISKN